MNRHERPSRSQTWPDRLSVESPRQPVSCLAFLTSHAELCCRQNTRQLINCGWSPPRMLAFTQTHPTRGRKKREKTTFGSWCRRFTANSGFMEIDLEEMGCMREDSAGSESSLISSKLYPNNKADPSESVPPAKERDVCSQTCSQTQQSVTSLLMFFWLRPSHGPCCSPPSSGKGKKRKSALKQ